MKYAQGNSMRPQNSTPQQDDSHRFADMVDQIYKQTKNEDACRYERAANFKPAFYGGIPLGVTMLCFSIMSSPRWECDVLFLLLSACLGTLSAYSYYKSSVRSLSLTKGAVVGGAVGVAAGIIYFTCSAIIYLIIANSAVCF
jgi:hypothetical protein